MPKSWYNLSRFNIKFLYYFYHVDLKKKVYLYNILYALHALLDTFLYTQIKGYIKAKIV